MIVNGFLCVFLAGGDEDSFCVPHHHINRVSHWITNFKINHSMQYYRNIFHKPLLGHLSLLRYHLISLRNLFLVDQCNLLSHK